MRTSQHEIQHADGYSAVCLNYYCSGETKLYGFIVHLFLYFFARFAGKFPGYGIRVHRLSNIAFRAAWPNENQANLKHAADVRKSLIARKNNEQMSGVIPLRHHVQNIYCCGVWPIKCRQGSKTNKPNLKKLAFDSMSPMV
jgi:hypothetical protein